MYSNTAKQKQSTAIPKAVTVRFAVVIITPDDFHFAFGRVKPRGNISIQLPSFADCLDTDVLEIQCVKLQ
jgi:hypothetical protein